MPEIKNKKLKIFQSLLFFCFLVILGLFISQETLAYSCANVPLSGNYEITTTNPEETRSCAFGGTVNGVEEGNLTIPSGATLTINSSQTVVWNSGYSVVINGSIAISKTAPGGQLRKTYIWLVDSDNDGYPSTATPVAQNDQPTTDHKKRSDPSFTTKFTYVAAITPDTADNNACADNAVTHLCGNPNNTAGTCTQKTEGEQGLAACKRCNGTSIDVAYIAVDTRDTEETNQSGTCYSCDGSGNNVARTIDGTSATALGCTAGEEGCRRCDAGSCTYYTSLQHDCAASYTCNASGICESACYANGDACSLASDCCSDYCVNGVCCNTACTGSTCQRCDSYSNAGAGTCGYVTSGDPDNECSQGSTASDGCTADLCSGTGYACGVQGSGEGGCPACGACGLPGFTLLRPNAAGTYAEFEDLECSPACTYHYQAVDEETPDDATTLVGSDVANKRDTFNLTDSGIPTGSSIGKITVYAWVRREGIGDYEFYIMIRSGTTDATSALISYNSSTWAVQSAEWTTDPNTGQAWTIAAVDALEAGAKTSGTSAAGVDVSQVYVGVGLVSPDGSCLNIADNTQDAEGSNFCNATCVKCSSGSCVNQSSSEDLFSHCPGSTASDGCESNNCSGTSASCGATYQTSGDGGCPTCKTCVGATSIACANYTNNTQDDTGCNGACQACQSGSCGVANAATDPGDKCGTTNCYTGNCKGGTATCDWYTSDERNCATCSTCDGATSGACKNIANGLTDAQGINLCTALHYRCNGAGSCTAPVTYGWSTCHTGQSGTCDSWCVAQSYANCANACQGGAANQGSKNWWQANCSSGSWTDGTCAASYTTSQAITCCCGSYVY